MLLILSKSGEITKKHFEANEVLPLKEKEKPVREFFGAGVFRNESFCSRL
jgi:hypothetical protein